VRGETDAGKVRTFLRELSRRARGPGSVYVTGGASAALLGWRLTRFLATLRAGS
jgi:hypothetical protein